MCEKSHDDEEEDNYEDPFEEWDGCQK